MEGKADIHCAAEPPSGICMMHAGAEGALTIVPGVIPADVTEVAYLAPFAHLVALTSECATGAAAGAGVGAAGDVGSGPVGPAASALPHWQPAIFPWQRL